MISPLNISSNKYSFIDIRNNDYYLNDSGINLIENIIPKEILDNYIYKYKSDKYNLKNIVPLTQGLFDKKHTWINKSEYIDISEQSISINLDIEITNKAIKLFKNENFLNEKILSKDEIIKIQNSKSKTNVVLYGSSYEIMWNEILWIEEYFQSIKINQNNINFILLGGKREINKNEKDILKNFGSKNPKDEKDVIENLSKSDYFTNKNIDIIYEHIENCDKKSRSTTVSTLKYLKTKNIINKNEITLFVSMQPFASRQGLMSNLIFSKKDGYNSTCIAPGFNADKIPKKFQKIYENPKVQLSVLLEELSRFFNVFIDK